ncbi:SDR family NAD(P)-dependent oxidoreductase [Nocardia xishanensis]|uniref:SDR family NAD(P)-dependent oxidoreductase n=1 Tax=Nocardia xishanensis TaxID=238964 RepID=A0ABW7X0A0_9NOCA
MDTMNSSAAPSASTALVTGATSGIGFSVGRALARLGWTVLVHGRSAERAREAAVHMGDVPGVLIPVDADLETRSGVRRLVDQVHRAAPDGLGVLVNNAGAAFDRHGLTADGVERTVAVNHLAAAGLAHSLESLLKPIGGQQPSLPRVIMMTSYLEARARPIEDWALPGEWTQMRAYASSKLTNLAYTYALAERWRDRIEVYAVDPGAVRTGFQRSAGGPLHLIGLVGAPLMSSPERPARTVVATATRPAAHPSGSYVRAVRAVDTGRAKLSSARSRDRAYQRDVYDATQRFLSG